MPVPVFARKSRFISDDFEERFPVVWSGNLVLRNDVTYVQMHLLAGNVDIAKASLPPSVEGQTGPIKILQRIQLDQVELDEKIENMDEHCVLLALPSGHDLDDLNVQTGHLEDHFVDYLIRKDAAGIVTVPGHGAARPDRVVHIFPACQFVDKNLARVDNSLLYNPNLDNLSFLMIIITSA